MTGEWISVSERLPEDGVKVLVCDNGKDGPYIDVGAMDRQEWCIDGDLFFRVTHWMPLPKPPMTLTDDERLAIQWIVGDSLSVDGINIQATLRGLLERTK